MKMKNKALKAFKLYFILVTLITILLMILGLLFDSDRTFGYQAYASPLIYAAVGVIPVFISNQEKELSMRELIIKRFFELLLIEAIYLGLAFSADSIPTERRGVVIGIAFGVALIYGLTFLVEYLFESVESKAMNEYLYSYQNKQNSH